MQTKLCFPAIPAQMEGKVTARALTKTKSIAAKHFTVLADEVTDLQLFLVFSFVDGDINIREDFIAYFVCLFVCLKCASIVIMIINNSYKALFFNQS